MKTLDKNQSGFGAIEVILVIFIIAILGGVGWYVLKAKKNTTTNYNNAANSQTVTKPATTTPTAKTYTAKDAASLVQKAYDSILAKQKNNGVNQAEIDTIKNDLSSVLYDKLSVAVKDAQSDPILCTQIAPESITATASAKQVYFGSQTVMVDEGLGANKDITITVDLSNLKITSITCPN